MTAAQLISFARGAPSLDIVDVEGLKAAAVRAFDADPAGVTAYGTSVGYLPLRKWIADEARRRAGAGAGHQRLAAGRRVPLRPPGPARRRGRGGAADVRPHAAQPAEQGRPGARRHHPGRTASTPTSCASCWSRACGRSSRTSSRTTRTRPASRSRWPKRHALLDLAAEYGFTIFEDDPYADIRFRGEPLPSMLSLDEHGVVVHASSFTKTVCPGVRVGYLVGPAPLIAEIAKTRDEPLHLARHGVPGDRPPVLRLG